MLYEASSQENESTAPHHRLAEQKEDRKTTLHSTSQETLV